jgi:hypothetical protein
MSLASMTGALREIRTRLLTFTPEADSTLATLLGSTASGSGSDGKLFLNQAPDDVTGFWGVLRLIDAPQQGMDGGFLFRCTAELILYTRGRKYHATVERMADVVQQAWLYYSSTQVGGVLIADRTMNRADCTTFARAPPTRGFLLPATHP